MEKRLMKKVLTIGLAAAALAAGIASTSGAAQAADWNHGRYDHHDRYDRHHWRGDHWRGGYRHHETCRSYRAWSPAYGRYVVRTRCF